MELLDTPYLTYQRNRSIAERISELDYTVLESCLVLLSPTENQEPNYSQKMSQGARLVAGAVKNIAARQGGRRRMPFRWNSWSGSAIAVLGGIAAASTLNRRKEFEAELELAEARVKKADDERTRLIDGLLKNTQLMAAEFSTMRKPEDIDKRLTEWVHEVAQGEAPSSGNPVVGHIL